MSGPEDTEWLDALGGKIDADIAEPGATAQPGVEPRSSPLALEALVLRKFIQSQESLAAPDLGAADAAREQSLIERARTEGLLRRPLIADARVRYAAAAMLIIAAGLGLWQSMLPPAETLRGTVNGIVHLEARDPRALKRRLTDELNAVDVRVLGYERLGHIGIDAELPQPVPAPIVEILERHHIPVPVDGVLTVEFDAPPHQ